MLGPIVNTVVSSLDMHDSSSISPNAWRAYAKQFAWPTVFIVAWRRRGGTMIPISQPKTLSADTSNGATEVTTVTGRIHWIRTTLIAFLLLGLVPELFAETPSLNEPSKWMVRGGPAWLETNIVDSSLTFAGTPLPGAELTVDNELHQGFLVSWMLNEHFALETAVSTPLNLSVNLGGGPLGNEFRAADIDALPVMFLGRYNLPWSWHGLRPFVGIGATYLWFRNAKTSDTFNAVAASFGAQGARIEVKNQWRPVVELGIDYDLGERWFTNVTWLHIEGDAKIAASFSGGTELVSEVSYSPQFFAMTLGYRFD